MKWWCFRKTLYYVHFLKYVYVDIIWKSLLRRPKGASTHTGLWALLHMRSPKLPTLPFQKEPFFILFLKERVSVTLRLRRSRLEYFKKEGTCQSFPRFCASRTSLWCAPSLFHGPLNSVIPNSHIFLDIHFFRILAYLHFGIILLASSSWALIYARPFKRVFSLPFSFPRPTIFQYENGSLSTKPLGIHHSPWGTTLSNWAIIYCMHEGILWCSKKKYILVFNQMYLQ